MRVDAKLFRLLTFSASLAIPSSLAWAQTSSPGYDQSGYYARLDLGWAWARDAKATGPLVSGHVDDLGSSPLAGVGVGYRFNRHLRADLTTGYAWGYELDDRDSAGNSWKADIEAWTTLLNVYLEYPIGDWSPYLTAGAGVSRNKTGSVTRGPTALTIDGDTTTEFAWQAGLGVGYALAPNWTLDVGYRYLDAGAFKSGDRASDGTSGNAISGDLRSHVAMLGVRYSFGGGQAPQAAPTPMPAAAPAIAPAVEPPRPAAPAVPELPRLYRVFFDWNKADISAEGTRILSDAATTAKSAQAQITRIVATGHADRSGTERYNMALSLRRANAVKSVLIREGIPENQIVVLGKGERENAVPTADGVREPLNRRVEIILE